MDDPKKRFRIRLYFTRFRARPALALLGVGILLSWARPGLWILGAGAIYSGTLLVAALSRPSDRQIDVWLREDTQRLREKALAMLNLDERDIEIPEPLQLAGPLTQATSLVRPEHVRVRRARDGTYRVSANKVLVLLPTEHFLGVFHCTYDSLRDSVFHSVATRYAYRNVVAVRRGENAEVFKGEELNKLKSPTGKELVPTQFFSLSISNGETFSVPMRAQVANGRPAKGPTVTELDRVYAAIEKLLEDKFQAA